MIEERCTKNHISFIQTSWKHGLSKKVALEHDLSCIIRKYDIFFPKIGSYSLDGKWKMIFLKKMHGNKIFSLNVPKRWSFRKGSRWDMIFLVLSGKIVFFFQKHDIFFTEGRWDMLFFKKYVGVRWSYPAKIRLKVIEVLDDILERARPFLCTFMETFTGVFIHCSPMKKPGNLIYGVEVWFLLQSIQLEIFYNE